MHLAFLISVGIWGGVTLSALAWGGRPERIVGATLFVDLLLTASKVVMLDTRQVQWGFLAVDAAALAAMLITLRLYFRGWLLAACAFECVTLLAQTPRILDPEVHWWAYAVVNNYAGLAVVLALGIGTILYRLRRARDATARDQ